VNGLENDGIISMKTWNL